MITVNLHTHTFRCGHAVGLPVDYAREAAEHGFHVLGMSDHMPFPDERPKIIRMNLSELDDYIREVREAQAAFPQLRILLALECEYYPEYDSYYRMLLEEKKMDYLIGSVHTIDWQGQEKGFWPDFHMDRDALMCYADTYVRMMESGFFLFGAHPDTFGPSIREWNADCEACAGKICEAAVRLNMPLEINASGWLKQELKAHDMGYPTAEAAISAGRSCPRPYPLDGFWRTASRYPVKAVVNADAHDPAVLTRYLHLGYQMAETYGIEVVYPFGK